VAAASCPEHLRRAFLGAPALVELRAGEHLYKVASIPIVRDRILASPWWIRQPAFDELRLRAGRLGQPVTELIRSRLAIANEWNPGMDTLYVVVLGAAVSAWEGIARTQPVTVRSREVLLTGGGRQLAVPELTSRHIAVEFSGPPPR